jgi:uncharacterized protein (TIGR02266 family)
MQTVSTELTTRRVPVVTAVTCEAGIGNPGRVLSMLDLSEGGFFVQTAYPLSIGTRLQCRFHLGDQPDPVHVHAEVAWVRPGPEEAVPPPGMGLRFLRLPGAVQDRVRAVIAAHNAQIQYFQQHRQLSEDAMRLSVPRVQLLLDDQATATRLTSWNGRSLVVTMALPFEPGQLVRAEGEDGHLQEQGRISWIQFVPQGADGPELALGIELQMNTWGQEFARRRPSSELAAGNDPEEWDYEILQSVPASLTLAPTLPLVEEPATEAAPARTEVLEPLLLRKAPAPLPELLPAPAPARDAVPEARPPGPVQPPAWAPRYPDPHLTTDTYPVSLGVSSGGWPLNARATAIVFFLVLGGLGLFGLLSSGSPDQLGGRSSRARYGWDEFLGRSKPAWTVTRNDRTELAAMKSPPSKAWTPSAVADPPAQVTAAAPVEPVAQAASTPPAAPVDRTPALAGQMDVTGPAGDHKPESAPRLAPVQFSSKGDITRLTVELEGPSAGNHHYTLADPAGVVIDLEGTRILQKNGFLGGDGRRIRKLKVVPMTSKARLIVYTQTLPARVQVETLGTRLTVSLHFSQTLARNP